MAACVIPFPLSKAGSLQVDTGTMFVLLYTLLASSRPAWPFPIRLKKMINQWVKGVTIVSMKHSPAEMRAQRPAARVAVAYQIGLYSAIIRGSRTFSFRIASTFGLKQIKRSTECPLTM